MTSGLLARSWSRQARRSSNSFGSPCACSAMRTSGKRISGAMRFHSASFTVLVTGTIMPMLGIVAPALVELGHPVEAHQRAELLEVVQRHRLGPLTLEVGVHPVERRAHGEKA